MMKLAFKYFIIASFTKHFLEIPYDSIIEVHITEYKLIS